MPDIAWIWETIFALLFAIFGGLARLLSQKGKKKYRWGTIVSELLVSFFVGTLGLLIARSTPLSIEMVGVVCWISGWMGARFVEAVIDPVLDKVALTKKKEEEKQ